MLSKNIIHILNDDMQFYKILKYYVNDKLLPLQKLTLLPCKYVSMQKIYENDYFIGRQKCRMEIKDNTDFFEMIENYLFV